MSTKHCLLLLLLHLLAIIVLTVSAFPLEREKSLAIIREINRRGPYLALITVFPTEEYAFFSSDPFINDSKFPYVDLSGRRFRVGMVEDKKVIYVRCGVGMKSNETIPENDVAVLNIENYNVPNGGYNSLGRIGYRAEQFYSEGGEPNSAQLMLWFHVTNNWLQLATTLQGMKLERCVNSSLCLDTDPKVVIGLRGSTANTFVDNASYRNFLFLNFGVSSADMESSAVLMTSLSNGYPAIIFRGLSDLAGGQNGHNTVRLFGSLAASNVAKVVLQFIKLLPNEDHFQF
ncbi:PREDICTED: bark storage protein B-like isoform X2 [Erythranthe guttata]|uniref:bark storage protein B-like isoform X2 n=1 Tax=Erythranthe guttata TaxID=4155 RepID=UPI00064E00C0|nr:PREDICTED: bark storage protein B-like isoform X2 [Erythranthe guttata]|eukprot:XP_012836687.1 PREDICTED: bark storage protein B-like isoform X2 [Erythranthe guttata]